ncbi:MAG: DedA family protein, partial [Alicyclobacillus sp.]|nr:DedA family protein [Alicyclobacillus sp.]
LFGAFVLEYLFVPVPGETVLTTTGILWHHQTLQLALGWLLTASTLGSFCGCMLAYALGRIVGRPFLLRFGRYVRLTPARLDRADALFAKYTVPTLVISRFIAGVRILIPYVAGINRVRVWVYAPVILISTLIWTTTFILAGGAIESAYRHLVNSGPGAVAPVLLAVLALVAAVWWGHRRLHAWLHRSSPTPPGGEDQPAAPAAPDEVPTDDPQTEAEAADAATEVVEEKDVSDYNRR